MKKIIAISLVILGAVFLSGCGQQPINSQTRTIDSQSSTALPAPISEVHQVLQVATTSVQSTGENMSWQTYVSKLGYSFEYPKYWHCQMGIEKDVQYGDNCLSDSSQKILDEMNKNGKYDYFVDDLEVEILNMGIDEYMKDPTTQKIGDIMLGERNAYDVIIGGYSTNYGVVTDFNGKVLEIKFKINEKINVGSNEKHILSTFKFSK